MKLQEIFERVFWRCKHCLVVNNHERKACRHCGKERDGKPAEKVNQPVSDRAG
jgi:hypothetical protein